VVNIGTIFRVKVETLIPFVRNQLFQVLAMDVRTNVCRRLFKLFFFKVVENFTISTDTKSWADARAACKKLGMDLASLETVKEFNCVKDKIELAGKHKITIYIISSI